MAKDTVSKKKLYDALEAKGKPHSEEAESRLLGCMLVDNMAASTVVEEMGDFEAFYSPLHQKIYKAIIAIINESKVADVVTVHEYMERNNMSDDNTLPYIIELYSSVISSANYREYMAIIKRDYTARRLIDDCNLIIQEAYVERDINKVLDIAEKKIYDIGADVRTSNLVHVGEATAEVMSRIDEIVKHGADSFVTKTGYEIFDRKVGGLANSDLIILAARPAVGKTTFALNILLKIALSQPEKQIAFFSLEMSKAQLAQRLLANISELEMRNIQKAVLNEDGYAKLWQASFKLGNTQVYVDDTTMLSAQSMLSKCRNQVVTSKKKLDLVIIDYIGLMSGDGKGDEGRTQEISKISRMLKTMAKELDCPVLALSQMNRNVEQRDSIIPKLSDLRESGSIEQDADIVAFLFKDVKEHEGCVILDVAKHRHGETSRIRFDFQKDYNRFVESKDQEINEADYRLNQGKN